MEANQQDRVGIYVAQGCGIGAALVAFFSVLGYIFRIPELYTWAIGVGMAFPTALAIAALGVSVFIVARRVERWP